MIEYIFPAFIFITSLFLLWLIIKPEQKLTNMVCLFGSGAITYFALNVSKTIGEQAGGFLIGFFIIELIVLAIVIFYQKEIIKPKPVSITYLIILLITFLITRGCYNDDKKTKEYYREKREKAEKEIVEYKSKYDFNVDSLNMTEKIPNRKTKKKVNLEFPVIVYRKKDNVIQFDLEFNKNLADGYKSYKFDSISTLVILENLIVDLGTYNNSKTRAIRIDTHIELINFRTMKKVNEITIQGSEPPASISYRRSAPESRSGAAPSRDEIMMEIKRQL